jgi:hypothetical protein
MYENTWEKAANLKHVQRFVDEYEARQAKVAAFKKSPPVKEQVSFVKDW